MTDPAIGTGRSLTQTDSTWKSLAEAYTLWMFFSPLTFVLFLFFFSCVEAPIASALGALAMKLTCYYFAHSSGCEVVMSMSVCLSARLSPKPLVRSLPNFLCTFPSPWLCQSSSGMLTIGCITYQREGGDGSAHRGRSVIYDCLVSCLSYDSIYVVT